MTGDGRAVMPSDVTPHVGWFDRFAAAASRLVSRAGFFAFAVLLVVVWAPSYWIFRSVDTWQLIVNTATTIGTWLLVALLQNSQTRADLAQQHKDNALAAGLAAFMDAYARDPLTADDTEARLTEAIRELRAAVGIEQRESA